MVHSILLVSLLDLIVCKCNHKLNNGNLYSYADNFKLPLNNYVMYHKNYWSGHFHL